MNIGSISPDIDIGVSCHADVAVAGLESSDVYSE